MDTQKWLKIVSCSRRKRQLSSHPMHTHPGFELFYCLSGRAHFLSADDEGQPVQFDLAPGEFIFIACGRPHHLRIYEGDNSRMILMNLRPCESQNATFTIGGLARLYPECDDLFSDGRFILSKDSNGELCALLSILVNSVVHYTRMATISCIIDLLLSACLIRIASLDKEKRTFQSLYVEHAVSYIEKNYGESFRVGDVAQHIGIHPTYLQRLFRERIGMTIVDYTNTVRIDHAKVLLENTGNSIIDIALECGFSSRQHFSRCFKALTGMNPKQYRMENRVPSSASDEVHKT